MSDGNSVQTALCDICEVRPDILLFEEDKRCVECLLDVVAARLKASPIFAQSVIDMGDLAYRTAISDSIINEMQTALESRLGIDGEPKDYAMTALRNMSGLKPPMIPPIMHPAYHDTTEYREVMDLSKKLLDMLPRDSLVEYKNILDEYLSSSEGEPIEAA